jgi:hypothetical protein
MTYSGHCTDVDVIHHSIGLSLEKVIFRPDIIEEDEVTVHHV